MRNKKRRTKQEKKVLKLLGVAKAQKAARIRPRMSPVAAGVKRAIRS